MKKILLFLFVLVLCLGVVEAFDFNGTVYDGNGSKTLSSVNVTVTVYNFTAGFEELESYSVLSNSSGWFNMTLPSYDGPYGYSPFLYLDNGTHIYVSKPLPEFPSQEFRSVGSVSFYLKRGAKVNVTVVNSTGSSVPFNYQLKDTRLGFPIDESFEEYVTQETIYIQADRNYSVMVYPNMTMPRSQEVTSPAVNSQIDIQFNTSESLVWVSGYATLQDGSANFDNLYIAPYLLEPGNNIFPEHSIMPADMSSWRGGMSAPSDYFNATTGFFNITLPAVPSPGIDYMLYVTAYNDTHDFAMMKNLSLLMDDEDREINITLHGANGDSFVNVTQESGMNETSFESVEVNFSVVNESGSPISSAFVEAELDYTSIGGTVFRLLKDLGTEDTGKFSLPILNDQDLELKVFSHSGAPKKTDLSSSDLDSEPVTITISPFEPGGIDDGFNDIFIDMIKSTNKCNVPDYNSTVCSLFPSGETNFSDFNPLTVVMGGGDISFVMGRTSNRITIIYKNADLIASGPPDVLFDGEAEQNATGGALAEAWRFGSNGPEIYDEVLIGFPYSANLSPSSIDAHLGKLYDEDFNEVWDADVNSTDDIPGGFSDFNVTLFNSTEGMGCSSTDENLTEGHCYIDTANRKIWIKIPHFSGVGPEVEGTMATSGFNLSVKTDATNYNASDIVEYTVNITNTGTENITLITVNSSFNSTYLDYNRSDIANSSGGDGFLYWGNLTNGSDVAANESQLLYLNMTALAHKNGVSNTFVVTVTDINGNTTNATVTVSVNTVLNCGDTVTVDYTMQSNLDCSGGSQGLTLGTGGITLDCSDYAIIGAADSTPLSGVTINNNHNITVKNCNITGFDYGIYVTNSENNTINDNTLSNNTDGVANPPNDANIYLDTSSGNDIYSNTISDSCEGILMVDADLNKIRNNVIDGNALLCVPPSTGIEADANSDNNNLVNNNFSDNGNFGLKSAGSGWTWNITSAVKVDSNNINYSGGLPNFLGGSIELVNNSYIIVNGTTIEITNKTITSLSLNTESIAANTSMQVNSSDDLQIDFYLARDVNGSVSSAATTPGSNPSGKTLVNALDIVVSNGIEGNLTWALIKMYYNESALPSNVPESSLQIYYYNESSGSWQLEPNQDVNTTGDYVWANVTHFSTFASYGTATSSDDSDGTSSSGGGGYSFDGLEEGSKTVDLNYGDAFTFRAKGSRHTVVVTDAEEDAVSLRIRSETIDMTLGANESISVDTDGNGLDDFGVKLNKINIMNNQPIGGEFTFTVLEEAEMEEIEIVGNVTDVEDNETSMVEVTPGEEEEEEKVVEMEDEKSNMGVVLIIGLVVLVILASAYILIRRKE